MTPNPSVFSSRARSSGCMSSLPSTKMKTIPSTSAWELPIDRWIDIDVNDANSKASACLG